MGGGGGGSESSTSTATTTTSIDKRMVVDNGVGVSSDSSTVHVTATDLGAIGRAFDFATGAGQSVTGTMDKVLGLADVILKGSIDAVKGTNAVVSQAYETAKTTQQGSIDQKTMIVLAVAGAAAYVMGRK